MWSGGGGHIILKAGYDPLTHDPTRKEGERELGRQVQARPSSKLEANWERARIERA